MTEKIDISNRTVRAICKGTAYDAFSDQEKTGDPAANRRLNLALTVLLLKMHDFLLNESM